MSSLTSTSHILEMVRHASNDQGLDTTGLRIIHHYSNAVCLLPAKDIIARLTIGTGAPARISRTQQLTCHLINDFGIPATAPLPVQPVAIDESTVVSFWKYYPQTNATPFTATHLGQALHQLHQVHHVNPPLEDWVPLAGLEATLRNNRLDLPITNQDRYWLLTTVDAARTALDNTESLLGHGVIHGDAWAGNLLWDDDRVILGDWDWAAYGPREADIIPTWHAAHRYGKPEKWVRDFVAAYGTDLSGWGGLEAWLKMRDLVQLNGPLLRAATSSPHARVLTERLDAIRQGDTTGHWEAL